MNNIAPALKLFKEFQTYSCSEMFRRSSDVISTSEDRNSAEYIRACFIMSYCCALFKDTDNAFKWRSDFRKAIGVRSVSNEMVSLNNDTAISAIIPPKGLEESVGLFAVEDMFLETHIMFNRLDFASAYETIRFGLAKSLEIGSSPFALLFMVMNGWLDKYLGNDDDASDNFRLAASFLETHQELKGCNRFFADMVTAGKCFLNSEDSSYLNNLWARYYHNELSWIVRLRNHERPEVSKPAFYKNLFGEMSCESYFDRILSSISEGQSIDSLRDIYDSRLSPNQKLYCEIIKGRPLTLSGINRDSFIIASPELCANYELCVRQDSKLNIYATLNAYDAFLRDSRFQIDLSESLPLLSGWIGKNGSVRDIVSFASVTGLQSLTSTPEAAARHCAGCAENFKCIQDLEIALTDYDKLELSLCIYKLAPVVNAGHKDYNAYIKSVISPLSLTINNLYKNVKDFKDNLSAFKTVSKYAAAMSTVFPAMLDNEVIRSVIISANIENHGFIVQLLEYAGESYDMLPNLERKYMETLIGDIFNADKGGLETSSVVSQGLYLRVNPNDDDGFDEFYIYPFSRSGYWYIEDENYWRNQSERIPSPLKNIINSDVCKRNAPIIFLLMSGAETDDSDFVLYAGDWNIKLYRISEIISELAPKTALDSGMNVESRKRNFLDFVFNTRPEKILPSEPVRQLQTEQQDWDFLSLIGYITQNVFSKDPNVYAFTSKIPERIRIFGLTRMLVSFAESMSGRLADFMLRYSAQFVNAEYAFSIEISSQSAEVSLESFIFYNQHPCDNDTEYLTDAPFYDDLRHSIDIYPVIDGAERVFCDVLRQHSKDIASCRNTAVFESYMKSRVLKFAVSSARTAIMARNMSHNLGSHVMAYLKQHLNSTNDMLRNRVFDKLFQNEEEYNSFISGPKEWVTGKDLEANRDIELPFLTGLGKFISYIQERQDFIAGIATNFTPVSSTLNFKDYIYDELNIDKRAQRHKDRKGVMPDNILLSYIARSEGLYREPFCEDRKQTANDIVLKFRTFDGDKAETESSEKDLDDMRRYCMSIPGGVTGRHALFTIIENIIRNAAKHGDRAGQASLELTFDIYDRGDIDRSPDNDNCESEYSLRQVFEKFYCGVYDSADYYYLTLTDNFTTSYDKLQKIRRALVDAYVEGNGNFRDNAKGLKEMRICAAWLRSQQSEFFVATKKNIDKHDTEWTVPEMNGTIPTLYARLSNGHLQFIMALKKPMDVLLVSDRPAKGLYDDINNRLSGHYWKIMTSDEFESRGPETNFDFIVLDGDDALYRRLRWKSSCRMFKLCDIAEMSDAVSYQSECKDDDCQLAEKLSAYRKGILWRLSDYEEGDMITISDEKTLANFRKWKETETELEKYIKVGIGIDLGDYSYETHYESSFVNAKRVADILDENKRFIEGITGANSTDRLLRCEPLNIEWFCRHLHAMKQRIAIFDERLSNKILAVKDTDMLASDRCVADSYEGVMYADKEIWIFNIVKSADNKSFVIYGLTPEKELSDDYEHSICVRIASISIADGKPVIEFANGISMFKNYFDRITIHQGLLDKIYGQFGYKTNVAAKELLTKTIYENFHTVENEEVIIDEYGHFFLPGMSIHSGRSKPAVSDMPQQLPFIQYASLEHAVLDCKYALTELLDTINV